MENHYITHIEIFSEKREVRLFIDGEIINIGLTDFEDNKALFTDQFDELAYDKIKHLESKLKCMKKAVKALSYSALNSFKLRQKLIKDFPSDIADEIVSELTSKKYIDNEYLALRAAESYCYGKLYGPKKIKLQLRNNGFKSFEIEDAISQIPDEDFYNNMQKLQVKKIKTFDEDDETEVLKALFFKYGYTDSQIYEYLQNL